MTVEASDLSRAVSHALRHEPWLYELELDQEGWVPVEQLVFALRERGGAWLSVDREALERMIQDAGKRRHELVGDRIRALYGHSVRARIQRQPMTPPERLFHGTAPRSWVQIQSDGLLPMGRQFVHLSVDMETAEMVGRRKSASPLLLVIDAAAAASRGVPFYQGNEAVWLADRVPAEFVARLG
jgi:putative RNA 2'-phosphotransferase